jgi:sugar phosphate isomerase/epimerase
MKIGICTSIDNAGIARDAGFDFVEENVQNLLVAEEPDSAFASKLAVVEAAPLPVPAANCFLPGTLKCTGPGVDETRLRRYADTALRRARQAGIRRIVFGSGGSRHIPDGFSPVEARAQFLHLLRGLAPLAEAQEVVIVVECLNRKECNFLNALREGAAIVEEIAHPHVRLLADLYHMAVEGEGAAELLTHGRSISHVHVAELEGRQAPGTSGEDFGPALRVLKQIGYSGALSFECGWQNLAGQAGASLKSFRAQVAEAGLA